MAKLIYIVSMGHSGSTLLDLVTGSLPGVFSTGEVVYLPWQLYRKKFLDNSKYHPETCTCGEHFENCKTWQKITIALSDNLKFNILDNPFRFKIAFLRSQRYVRHERLFTRILRGLATETGFSKFASPIFKILNHQEIKNNWWLFDTIGQVLNVDYIVDSSKDFARMKYLHAYRPADTKLIILKRNIFGVAYSGVKQGHDPVIQAKKWLKIYQKVSDFVKNQPGISYHLVEYEKLCADPVIERERIGNFLGIDLPDKNFSLNTSNYHLVAGNPMRYKGEISIKSDEKWREGLNSEQISTIQKLTDRIPIPLFHE